MEQVNATSGLDGGKIVPSGVRRPGVTNARRCRGRILQSSNDVSRVELAVEPISALFASSRGWSRRSRRYFLGAISGISDWIARHLESRRGFCTVRIDLSVGAV